MDYNMLSDVAEYVSMGCAIIAAAGAVYALFGKSRFAKYINGSSNQTLKENNLEKEVKQ
ncbi:MAG: hypothetical protein KGH55_01665 [Nanoarchaeota archaeon]|nr:hypothetical protein [Nanoarchaeota archaeon]